MSEREGLHGDHAARRRAITRIGKSDDGVRAEMTKQMQTALAHLHDLSYLQTHPLTVFLTDVRKRNGRSQGEVLQQHLLAAIASLAARIDDPPGRTYDVLRLRYVELIEVRAICKRLGIGRTQFYKDLQIAVDAVASIIHPGWWESTSKGFVNAPQLIPLQKIPTQQNSFVGRQWEMGVIKSLLQTTRLLTLTGTGGCGKTRLALQTAAELVDSYPDGIVIVALEAVTDPFLVRHTIARALGIQEERDQVIRVSVIRSLENKRILLMLDGCEHLIAECALFASILLDSCPTLHILAMSREGMHIAGETRWPVPALTVPSVSRVVGLEHIASSEAVGLFIDRARSVHPRFTLTERNASSVIEICQELDGIPLAIELAAAWTKSLTVDEIAMRLPDIFRRLSTGSRLAPSREQVLEATFDWSYIRLSEPEQRIFRQLAVFSGSFVLSAAEAVCVGKTADSRQVFNVLSLLGQLVEKSLVLAEEHDGETRYRMLRIVRQYAYDRLEKSGEMASARQNQRDWYLAFTERARVQLRTPAQAAWLKHIEIEQDNVRGVLTYCLESDDDSALRLSGNLIEFWRQRGYFREARRLLSAALYRRQELTKMRARPFIEEVKVRFKTLSVAPWDYERAIVQLETAATVYRDAKGSRPLMGTSMKQSRPLVEGPGGVEEVTTTGRWWDPPSSLTSGSDAIEKWRSAQGFSRESRAFTYFEEWRNSQTVSDFFEQSVHIYLETADKVGLAEVLQSLGLAMLLYGCKPELIQDVLQDSLNLSRTDDVPRTSGWALVSLGCLEGVKRDNRRAYLLIEEGLVLFRQIGDLWSTGQAEYLKGWLLFFDGDLAQAQHCMEDSLRIARHLDNKYGVGCALVGLAKTHDMRHDLRQAEVLLREATLILSEIHNPLCSTAIGFLGTLAIQQGRYDRGVYLLAQATRSGVKPGARSLLAVFQPAVQSDWEASLTRAKLSIKEEAFANAWANGSALPWNRANAIDVALGKDI